MTIPTHLIENALNLTGKTMEDMQEVILNDSWVGYTREFSIEKFSYFLLSEEFIEKYEALLHGPNQGGWRAHYAMQFGLRIFEYQRKDKEFPDGNPGPLIDLLTKIPGTPTTTHH